MPAVQARPAAPLLPATPQPISLALTQHMTKGLHLACRASQRLVGLDQPHPQDAERSCMFDGSTEACSFNTRACLRTRVQTSSLSRKREAMLEERYKGNCPFGCSDERA